jgi:hypothetical protein
MFAFQLETLVTDCLVALILDANTFLFGQWAHHLFLSLLAPNDEQEQQVGLIAVGKHSTSIGRCQLLGRQLAALSVSGADYRACAS